MSTRDNGGWAFPVPNDANFNGEEGMTLRDYFAGQFLSGRAAVPGYVDPNVDATLAYQVADAMLEARK